MKIPKKENSRRNKNSIKDKFKAIELDIKGFKLDRDKAHKR